MAAPKVEYNFLGRSGMKVSNICLGTMTFGQDPKFIYKVPTQSNEEVSHKIMDKYAEMGGNFLDTANVYNYGASEAIIGKWLSKYEYGTLFMFKVPTQSNDELSHKIMDKYAEMGGNFIDTANQYNYGASEAIIGKWLSKKERDRYVIATKVYASMDQTNPNAEGLSRRHIVDSIEKSLERLQTNYIDLYQSHGWDTATPLDETLRTFDDLIRCGKVRYYGASNVCGWHMQKMVDRMEMMGLNKCVSLQQQYNLLCRQSEFEAFMVCREEGIGVIPWSPLKGGLLTGKYKKDDKPNPEKSRLGYISKNEAFANEAAPSLSAISKDENYWKLIDTMRKIAASHGKSVPQVALRWLLQKDFVPSVIIGATSVAQLEDNMGAATGWALSVEEMELLDDISPRDTSYPYSMLWGLSVMRPVIRENKYIPSTVEKIVAKK